MDARLFVRNLKKNAPTATQARIVPTKAQIRARGLSDVGGMATHLGEIADRGER